MNNIILSRAVTINAGVTIRPSNASGEATVTLAIAQGAGYRHFSTVACGADGAALIIGAGITLDGGGTGGGITMFGAGCRLALGGSALTHFASVGNGGGILIQGRVIRSGLFMTGTLISNCISGAAGGGFFASDCDIELTGAAITGNRAATQGGGIQTLAGGDRLGCTLTIRNSGGIQYSANEYHELLTAGSA